MSTPQPSQSNVSDQFVSERCLCRDVADAIRECFGISPTVRQHLANSRIEFLKALRQVLDERIEHLSSQEEKGTKVAVE